MAGWLSAPFEAIYQMALALCVRKNCWLKDLRGVTISELYAQADMIKEAERG